VLVDQTLQYSQYLLLQMIGEEVDRSPVQVILKWALQSGMVCEKVLQTAV
jgi:diketogulonate reductase-like aldo/keto reductase